MVDGEYRICTACLLEYIHIVCSPKTGGRIAGDGDRVGGVRDVDYLDAFLGPCNGHRIVRIAYTEGFHAIHPVKQGSGVTGHAAQRDGAGGVRNVDYLDGTVIDAQNYRVDIMSYSKYIRPLRITQQRSGVLCHAAQRDGVARIRNIYDLNPVIGVDVVARK